MTTIRNVFVCMVHESQECVVDLVRNLRCLDPDSDILLYNGGTDPHLLDPRLFGKRYGTLLHPQPRPCRWGRLHEGALDCMQFALDHLFFETLTFVDSDQLLVRSGYSSYLARFLSRRRNIGLLGNAPVPQPSDTQNGPARTAFREFELWRPFLERFSGGLQRFIYWSHWGSTVFTVEAARDLTRLWATDTQLQQIMRQTKILVTEEVILPTLVALLGYKIAANPCSYDYVRWRVTFTPQQIEAALAKSDVYWVHPVARRYQNPIRSYIRASFGYYNQIKFRASAAR